MRKRREYTKPVVKSSIDLPKEEGWPGFLALLQLIRQACQKGV